MHVCVRVRVSVCVCSKCAYNVVIVRAVLHFENVAFTYTMLIIKKKKDFEFDCSSSGRGIPDGCLRAFLLVWHGVGVVTFAMCSVSCCCRQTCAAREDTEKGIKTCVQFVHGF